MQSAEDENALLAWGELIETDAQVLEQLLGVSGLFAAARRRGDVVQHLVRDIVNQRAGLHAARAQVIEGKVARSLEHERLQVLDGAFAQGAGDPQVGLWSRSSAVLGLPTMRCNVRSKGRRWVRNTVLNRD